MTLLAGTNSITATDTDLAGNSGTSPPVTFTLATRRRRFRSAPWAVTTNQAMQTITGKVTETTES